MSKYVISTLTADTKYVNWAHSGGVNMEGRSVVVKGGAGIALIGGGRQVRTPEGVRTEVSDADAEFLANHPHFQEHIKGGFVRLVNGAADPDKAAKSMGKDASRPKTNEDVAEDNKKNKGGDEPLAVTTNVKSK